MASPVSPQALMNAMVDVAKLRAMLGDEDSKLLLDSIEGETRALEILDQIIEQILKDETLVDAARRRAQRIERRAKRWRTVVLNILATLPEPYASALERPLYTASVSWRADAQEIDAALLPEAFWNRIPNERMISSELHKGHDVPGYMLGNEHPVLRLTWDRPSLDAQSQPETEE